MPEQTPVDIDSLSPLADVVTRLDAQAILCIGHNTLYAALRRGELEAVKDGSKTLITIESLKRYQANRPRAVFKPLLEPRLNSVPAPRRRRRKARA
jgi:Helix-turn-helix domain